MVSIASKNPYQLQGGKDHSIMMEHKVTAYLSEKLMMLLFLRMRSSDATQMAGQSNKQLHTTYAAYAVIFIG